MPNPLFKFADWSCKNEISAFLGREWLFKELHQMVIVEKALLVLIQGNHGSGKSAILNQLTLNSSFFANSTVISLYEIHFVLRVLMLIQ